MEVAHRKIPFPALQCMDLYDDCQPLRGILKNIRQQEIKKGFIAEILQLELALDGEDFKNNRRTLVIKYNRIPLYN